LTNRNSSYIVANPMNLQDRTRLETGSAATNRRMAEFQRRCKAEGLRITPQRMAVYRELISTTEHPSAESVFRQVRKVHPNISFDTVNRTLLTLVNLGAAFVVEGTGEAKRFDGGEESHQHFRCVKCRKIVDFRYGPFDDIETPPAIRGFRIMRKTVYFEGVCDRCEGKNSNVEHEKHSYGGQ
jgi:Fur family transcriptional regulator, peroxide stress response regulator